MENSALSSITNYQLLTENISTLINPSPVPKEIGSIISLLSQIAAHCAASQEPAKTRGGNLDKHSTASSKGYVKGRHSLRQFSYSGKFTTVVLFPYVLSPSSTTFTAWIAGHRRCCSWLPFLLSFPRRFGRIISSDFYVFDYYVRKLLPCGHKRRCPEFLWATNIARREVNKKNNEDHGRINQASNGHRCSLTILSLSASFPRCSVTSMLICTFWLSNICQGKINKGSAKRHG